MALVFPNLYHVGMSNLGFRLVYHLLNRVDEIVCERFFLPEGNTPLRSVESNRPLVDFPVVLFSISFETDFINVLKILLKAGISPWRKERVKGPVILAGGVGVWLNPDPLSPFVDGFLVAEIEPILKPLLEALKEAHIPQGLTEALKGVPGFLHADYQVFFNAEGYIEGFRALGQNLPVKKVWARHLEEPPFSDLITPETTFTDTYLLEVGRGCGRGCRFCAAGMLYRPPRPWSLDTLLKALERIPQGSKVGLIGLEFADQHKIETLAAELWAKDCELTFSSLRADSLTPGFVRLLTRQRTATIAPEAGSQRLRQVINKGLEEKDILEATRLLAEAGVHTIKLYFMVGLPTETEEDLQTLVALVKKIRHTANKVTRPRGYMVGLRISVACFVPKPWTPFQWAPFLGVKDLKQRLKWIRHKIGRIPNTVFTADLPKWAFLQALIARGDRRLAPLLYMLAKEVPFSQGLKTLSINPDFLIARMRDKEEVFAWEVIDPGVKRAFLWEEWQKALREKPSPPCLPGKCRRCGAC